jgi:hypothetical protein
VADRIGQWSVPEISVADIEQLLEGGAANVECP